MNNLQRTLAACLLVWASSGMALAAETPDNGDVAGMIKTSRGEATIERAGAKLPAAVGAQVFEKDRLRTGADGALGVTLRDNTLLSAGANSLITLDRFNFDDTTHDGKLSVGVRKGSLSVATGKIAKRAPESVDFHTPTSVLGVRGTEFVIEVIGGKDE